MELKIEYLPVEDLHPYENNVRIHEGESIDAIKASIEKYGFDDPIGIWGDNIIVEGHGRLEASKQLGYEKVPCIRLDHLTDQERKEYAIAHNRTTELSRFDFGRLEEELENLELDLDVFKIKMSEPLELEDSEEIEYDINAEEDSRIMCHCPKCGFYFEVKK